MTTDLYLVLDKHGIVDIFGSEYLAKEYASLYNGTIAHESVTLPAQYAPKSDKQLELRFDNGQSRL